MKKKKILKIKPETLKVLKQARRDNFTEAEVNQAEQDVDSLFEIKDA